MTDETPIEVGSNAVVHFNDGTMFLADYYAHLGNGLIMVTGDWERHVELIGMPQSQLIVPLTSVHHIRIFDAESTAVEVEDELKYEGSE